MGQKDQKSPHSTIIIWIFGHFGVFYSICDETRKTRTDLYLDCQIIRYQKFISIHGPKGSEIPSFKHNHLDFWTLGVLYYIILSHVYIYNVIMYVCTLVT